MIRVNFLDRPTYENLNWLFKELFYFGLAVIIVGSIIFLDYHGLTTTIESNEVIIADLESEKRKLEGRKRLYEEKKKKLDEIKRKVEEIKAVFLGRSDKVMVLEHLQVNTPKQVWFDKINISEDNQIQINASATTPNQVARLLTNFMESKKRLDAKVRKEREADAEDFVVKRRIHFKEVNLRSIAMKRKTQSFYMSTKAVFSNQ